MLVHIFTRVHLVRLLRASQVEAADLSFAVFGISRPRHRYDSADYFPDPLAALMLRHGGVFEQRADVVGDEGAHIALVLNLEQLRQECLQGHNLLLLRGVIFTLLGHLLFNDYNFPDSLRLKFITNPGCSGLRIARYHEADGFNGLGGDDGYNGTKHRPLPRRE